MQAAAVVLLSLAAAVSCENSGLIKVIHEGNYRARVETSLVEGDMVIPDPIMEHGQELVPYDFKVHAPSEETAIAATRVDPYTVEIKKKFYQYQYADTVNVKIEYVDLSKRNIQWNDWKELVFDSSTVDMKSTGAKCYRLGGTVDEPTWSVYNGKDMPGCIS